MRYSPTADQLDGRIEGVLPNNPDAPAGALQLGVLPTIPTSVFFDFAPPERNSRLRGGVVESAPVPETSVYQDHGPSVGKDQVNLHAVDPPVDTEPDSGLTQR